MKKLRTFISLLLALAMLSALAPTAAFGASTMNKACGENLTWDISNGTLTISGTGAMDYTGTRPWNSIADSIKTVIIEDGVTSIQQNAFKSCKNLTKAEIPSSVKVIGDYAFKSSSLKDVEIPYGVTTIGTSAFGWTDITIDTIPDSVTNIGDYAFSGIASTSITLPKYLKVINEMTFTTCEKLKHIDIPGNVTTIGYGAFDQCIALESVTIPLSVTKIEEAAFSCCIALEDVYYAGSKSDKNKIKIEDQSGNYRLHGEHDYFDEATWHYNSEKAEQAVKGDPDVYYTVTFDGYGVAEVAPQLVAQFDFAEEPKADMSREGYTFLGWYNEGIKYDFETSIVSSDITLTPMWEDEEKVYRDSQHRLYYSKVISKSGLTQPYYITLTGSSNTLSFSKSGTYDIIKSTEWTFPTGIVGDGRYNNAIVYATEPGIYEIWLSMVSTYTYIAYDAYNKPYNVTVPFDDSCSFYVHAFDEISKIAVPSEMNMSVGESRVLDFSTTPSGNYARQASGFDWYSSDKDVVTIRSDGVLTAVGAGTATITLVTTSGTPLKATCTVTVTQGASSQLSTSTSSSNSSGGISVTLNGSKIAFDQQPVIIDGRTMVPLRAIFEALGASVAWDNSTQTVVAIKDGKIVQMTIGDATMYVGGTAVTLDVAPQLVNSRTLVPARAVAEAFDCSVSWNDATKTVVITN